MNRISLLVPTRGRPLRLSKMRESALNTVSNPDSIEFIFGIDFDDEATKFQIDQFSAPPSFLVLSEKPKIKKLTERYNSCASSSRGDILWNGNDDFVFRTKNWDLIVREEFEKWSDRIGIVFCNDMLMKDRLAAGFFISKEWYNALGYFVPQCFDHYCPDVWIDEIAKAIGRRSYISNCIIEHEHFSRGHEKDETYRNAEHLLSIDRAILEDKKGFLDLEITRMKSIIWRNSL